MFSFSLLVNAGDIEKVICHLKSIFIVFGHQYVSHHVQKALMYLNSEIQQINNASTYCPENKTIDEAEIGDEQCTADSFYDEQHVSTASKRPFLPYICKRLGDSIPIATNDNNIPNEYYKPTLRQVLEKKWLGMLLFWSEIMYGKLKVQFFFHQFFTYYSTCYLTCMKCTCGIAMYAVVHLYVYTMSLDACVISNTGTTHKLANIEDETVCSRLTSDIVLQAQ